MITESLEMIDFLQRLITIEHELNYLKSSWEDERRVIDNDSLLTEQFRVKHEKERIVHELTNQMKNFIKNNKLLY